MKIELTQEEVQEVACPVCRANADEPCTERGKPRKNNHLARVQIARGKSRDRGRARDAK